MICTRDTNDKNELERMSFQNKEDMENRLDELAQTNDPEVGYVDIYLPVPLLQVKSILKYNTKRNNSNEIVSELNIVAHDKNSIINKA